MAARSRIHGPDELEAALAAYELGEAPRAPRGLEKAFARRMSGAGGARRGSRGSGGGGIDYLLNYSQGTFTRASEAAAFDPRTGLWFDVATPWPGTDVRRLIGSAVLIEGARTNLVTDGRDLTAAAWTSIGSPTITTDYAAGPDGLVKASRCQGSSTDALYDGMGTTASSVYQVSCFQRQTSGTGPEVLRVTGGASSASTGDASAGETWTRRVIAYTAGASTNILPLEGRDTSGEGGLPAGSRDHLADLCGVELGAFPSTPIRTSGGTATRAVDLLQYAGGTWDDRINDAVWEFDVWPNFADSDMATGEFHYMFNVGSTEILYFYNNAGTVEMRLNRNGVAGFTPVAVTFSRYQKLTIKLDWPAQTMSLSGFTSGDGNYNTLTASDWGMTPASDILVVGGGAVANRELHGVISQPRAA